MTKPSRSQPRRVKTRMPKTKHPSSGSKCPSCNTALRPNAKFCHECGAPAGKQSDAKRADWKSVAPFVVMIAVVGALLVFGLGYYATEQKNLSSPPQSDAASSSRQPEPLVDLSTMSPREAADRLFNRVMAADERGDSAQATQLAPMALQAYRLVERPDADVHYHMGLISLVLGDIDEARMQIENVKQDSADHLLGMALASRVAKRIGDDKSASDILARFAAAYDAELRRGKPEYEAHRITIERLHASATGSRTTESSNQNPKGPESGAQLFASRCAGCHGPSASGSDKGPPLVHQIYEPGHHTDAAFYQAVRQGVKSHHWSFGNMMPIPGITDEQIGQIVSYVRNLQVKNGIK